jgi:hypothetical protein
LLPAGEDLPAKDSADFDVIRIRSPHSANRLIQHAPAQDADIVYSANQYLPSEDGSSGYVHSLPASYS